ncbi:Serine/threonine-protein kinase TOR [Capsicum baccatum]|uniref:Serine/threonine-protein kinase TOR n=1 Tax=Capsicum baccatum TaxID=33114 RepID=A0A2G2VC32_CAPBA|nr:Serine/threonine-protein kinase TOR [Capsicum baccatum]
MKIKEDSKDGAALTLRRLVEEEARDLSGDAFARSMDYLYERITTFLDSNEVSENLGALRAIYELINVTISENASNVEKFSNYMRAAFETKCDPEILVLASKVLGHLARSGGAMTADKVERQVKVALEWLRNERIEHRRFAAVLILKEMAENASTVFNVHVPEFVDVIWVALRDPTLDVRGKAVESLGACLHVIEKCETRWRVQWYYRMFEATQDGLGTNAPVHSIHGSFLAVGELLRNTGEFMMSRYREVAEIVLRYMEHRDRLVCLSITSLLPRIAHFLRDQFVTNYLMICMNHILHVLKIPAERASRFIALGEMAGALNGELINYLPIISSHLRDGVMLYMSLQIIPTLLTTIQNRLLEFISTILSRSHHSMPRQLASVSQGHITMVTPQVPELSGSALVQLDLRTLTRFYFKGHDLLEFARESVVVYIEDGDGAIRKDVALCCCKLVANSFSAISFTQFSPSRINRSSGKRRHRVVEEVYF